MSGHAVDIIVRVLLSILFGGLVGLERELTDHPAGIRTHILVTAGSCIFTTVSLYGFPGFAGGDRIAAAVVTGIGFIGGGAILRSRDGIVTGLTTAASLWSCAAIGMLVGVGFFVVGLIVTAIDLVVLELIDRLVDSIAPRVKRRKLPLTILGDYTPENIEQAMALLGKLGCHPELLRYRRMENGSKIDLFVVARVPAGADLQALTSSLYEVPGITDVSWGE